MFPRLLVLGIKMLQSYPGPVCLSCNCTRPKAPTLTEMPSRSLLFSLSRLVFIWLESRARHPRHPTNLYLSCIMIKLHVTCHYVTKTQNLFIYGFSLSNALANAAAKLVKDFGPMPLSFRTARNPSSPDLRETVRMLSMPNSFRDMVFAFVLFSILFLIASLKLPNFFIFVS